MRGIEELLNRRTREWELVGGGLIRELHFGQAQGSELIETFLHGEIELTPALREGVDEKIGEHHHQGVTASPGLKPDIDRAHFEVDGLAFAEGPLDEGEIFVAFVDEFFRGGGRGEIGFQDIAAIELGGLGERLHIFLQREGALLKGERGPGVDL